MASSLDLSDEKQACLSCSDVTALCGCSPGLEDLVFGAEQRQAERDRSVKIPLSKRNAAAAAKRFVRGQILDFKDQHDHESENAPRWRSEILPQIQRLIAGGKGRSSLSR